MHLMFIAAEFEKNMRQICHFVFEIFLVFLSRQSIVFTVILSVPCYG